MFSTDRKFIAILNHNGHNEKVNYHDPNLELIKEDDVNKGIKLKFDL